MEIVGNRLSSWGDSLNDLRKLWGKGWEFKALVFYLVLIVFSPDFVLWELEAHVVEFRLSDLFLVFLLCVFFYRWAGKGEKPFFPRFTVFVSIYVGAYLLSALVGFAKGGLEQGFQGMFFALKHLEYSLVFLVGVNLCKKERVVSVLVKLFVFLAFLAGLWLLINPLIDGLPSLTFTIDLETLSVNYHHRGHSRHTIPFARGLGPSGEFMVVALPLVIFSLLNAGFTSGCLYYTVVFGVMLAGFLFTGSRGPIGGFFGSIVVLGPFLDRRIFFLIVAGLIIAGLVVGFVPVVRNRLVGTFSQFISSGLRIRSLEKRVFEIWPRGIRQFLQNPLLGRGLAGFKSDDTQYVRTLANQGLVGIVAFFAFVYGLIKNLLKVNGLDGLCRIPKILGSALIITTVGLLINGITATSFQPVRAMEPFWFLLGLGFALEKFAGVESG